MEPKEENQTGNEEIKTTEGEKISKKAELGYPRQVVYCPSTQNISALTEYLI